MAKAREIPGLDGEMAFAAAAAATVRVRAQELVDLSDGVLDTTDIEAVHDMRVASRRLRAALEVYAPCFAARALKPVLRDVKALADALGDRRDPDVQLEALEAFSAAAPDQVRPGVEQLAARLRTEQAQANERLATALDEMRETDLAGRLQQLAGTAEPQPDPAPEAQPAPSAPAHVVAAPLTEGQ